jgi:UDP-2-acetamido-3-amino-2,3-dideoxy-glucuronate N-acetyltransferase
MEFFSHETAVIDDGAKIGDDTKVWHFSHVCAKAVIGERCSIGQNVFVANNATVGNGVKVQNNVSLYEGVILEDYTFCGPSMVFTNVKTPRSKFPRNTASDYYETRVRYGASIGANATIVCGIEVGKWSFVAAGAVVTKNVPNYALMAGVPAKIIGWACACGETLKFANGTTTCLCEREYSITAGTQVKKIGGPDE